MSQKEINNGSGWPVAGHLALPAYERGAMQTSFPTGAVVLLARTAPNARGEQVTYKVRAGKRATEWWVSATVRGFRVSGMLHTTLERKARAWMEAIERGTVTVGDSVDETTGPMPAAAAVH